MKKVQLFEGNRGIYQKTERYHMLMDQQNNIINSKINSRSNTIPNFKVYHSAIVMNTTKQSLKNRHGEQWNRILNPDINPYMNGHLIFYKESINTQQKKDSIFKRGADLTGYLSVEEYYQILISPAQKLRLDDNHNIKTHLMEH